MLQRIFLIGLLAFSLNAPAQAASPLERMILQELNVARTNPTAYVRYLTYFRTLFHGKNYTQPGNNELIETSEGTAAVDDALAALKKQKPVSSLRWNEHLTRPGRDLIVAQQKSRETGHGSGRNAMMKRFERNGAWLYAVGECISYGPYTGTNGRDVVAQLLVDDGVPGRGHRQLIYDPDFKIAGVACGPHPVYGTVCVIDFAGGEESP